MEKAERNREREKLIQAAVNGSPYYRHVNMRVMEFNDTGSVMDMEVLPQHKNIWGTVHGGVIAGLIDSSCGTAIAPVLAPDETVVTLDLKVQFLRPVREGRLTARGRVVHRSRRFVHTESEIFDADNNLSARGNAIHAVMARGEG
ncbi:MAG TPA: PaaI family thioesterase [bacterium]|nr:PaaI family thioesterase [bacterium]